MGTLVYPASLVAGEPENVNDLNSNLDAIASVVNGGIDTDNLSASANIAASQLSSAAQNTWLRLATAGNRVIKWGTATPGSFGGNNYASFSFNHEMGITPTVVIVGGGFVAASNTSTGQTEGVTASVTSITGTTVQGILHLTNGTAGVAANGIYWVGIG